MKIIAAIATFAFGACMAADSGEALAEPLTILKIVTAIESSGIDGLVSNRLSISGQDFRGRLAIGKVLEHPFGGG